MMDGGFEGSASDAGLASAEAAGAAPPVMLPKHLYHQQAAFDEEMRRLFPRHWQFVAMRQELAEPNDFITLDLPGQAIVVQNFKGELKAFQNVCTHRFNRIQTEERGRRPLMCGYHGWSFDRTGFPVGRPKKEQFPAETEEERARLCLPSYRLDTCGDFVFVDLSGEAPPLRDFLGGVGATLEEISTHLGAPLHFGHVRHAANWKLLVENVLECYHCAIVHTETFVTGLGIGRLPIDEVAFAGAHSSCHFPRSEIPRENLRKKILSHLDARGYSHQSFFHVHVFPNLFIASQEGLSFYVGHAVPVGPRETMLRTRYFEPKVELTEGQRARQDMLNAQTIEIGLKVLEEDRAILENVQRGLELSDRPGALGADEIRIAAFFEQYRAAIG
jgi:phenylpropionate dioxygenase-like ring-hydroxylating dioxygenase large terminal subunit